MNLARHTWRFITVALATLMLTLSPALSALPAQAATIIIQPDDSWDIPAPGGSKVPPICAGNWWNPSFQAPSPFGNGKKGDWYAHAYQGDLAFDGHEYERFLAVQNGSLSMSDVAGGSELFWDLYGQLLKSKIQLPKGITGAAGYLALDYCNGPAPQRAYNWSNKADRELYIFGQNTMVIRSNAHGWHEVRGAINTRYRSLKGWYSWLGLPTSDEIAIPGGRASRFALGSIVWSPQGGAYTMGNDVFDKWQSLGGANGPLGNPLGDNEFYQPRGTTTGTTTPVQLHWTKFQNGCRVDGSNGGARAYCNGKEIKSWTPPPAANKPPVATFSYTRLTGAGNKVNLDGGASSDPDGTIANWKWTGPGGITATGRTATMSLGNVSSAAVTLTVTDNKGATANTTKTLSVGNRTPSISGVSPTGLVGSNTPTLSATASDPDGDNLQYQFHLTGPSVDITSGWGGSQWTVPAHRLDPGTGYHWTITVRDNRGGTISRAADLRIAMLPTARQLIATSDGGGYWQVTNEGRVHAYGNAKSFGSLPDVGVHVTNIIGMARTATNQGYWLVGSDGGVFAFGDAPFSGSMGGKPMNAPVVGMAPDPDGQGYWLVGADGGIFAFDAPFYGSMGGQHLNAPVEGIAPTASGQGYYLVAKDGGVFAFGDAPFLGSMGGKPLNAPVVDIAADPDGRGYWLVAEDGGVFAYEAGFYGSMTGKQLNGRITSLTPGANGTGYWLNGCDGGVFAFNVPFYGSNPTYGCRGI